MPRSLVLRPPLAQLGIFNQPPHGAEMSIREVPFNKNAVCDSCGTIGAYDFMGGLLCQKCADGITEAAEDIGLIEAPA